MNALSFGAADAFDALVYGETPPSTLAYMQERISQFSQTMVGAGRSFVEKAQEAFNHYNGTAAMQFVRQVLNTTRGAMEVPRVRCLWDLEEIQNATSVMQRWVMANPALRTLYHQQKCDGYSDSYIDMHPGKVGPEHYDYRRATDSMMLFDPEGDWKVVQYGEQLLDGDRKLIFEEKIDIARTWDIVDILVAAGMDDPSSNVGGKL